MSNDWKVGDLALCVDAQPHPIWGCNLVEGAVYRVSEVLPEWHCLLDPTWNGPGLNFIEQRSPSPHGFACERFHKIRPDQHEDCEPEFVTLLNRIKPTVPVEAGGSQPCKQESRHERRVYSDLWVDAD